MKAGSIAIAALASLAAAQPHKNLHKHKRGVVTEIKYATATADSVVVYVNEAGEPVSTQYLGQAAPTPAPVAAAQPAAAPAYVPAAPAPAPAAPAPAAPVVAHPAVRPAANSGSTGKIAAPQVQAAANNHQSSAAASYSSTDSSVSASAGGPGIAYSPYNTDNSCKSASAVKTDLAKLTQFPLIRLYGVDCNQVTNVLQAFDDLGTKQQIFAGLFNINAISSDANTLVSAVAGRWSRVNTVNCGNELLNQRAASASQLVTAINTAKSVLKPAGYSGPVVYVDTFNAMIAQNKIDSSLCEASDYSAANAHAFFDPSVAASGAGDWLAATVKAIAASCPGKKVVITESGWPSAGTGNGAAIPSVSNQQTAISSIKNAVKGDGLILFSAYNDLWKVNAGWNFFAEQSYGIYGNCPSSQ